MGACRGDMSLQYRSIFVALADPTGHRLTDFYQTLLAQQPAIYTPDRYSEFQLPGLRLSIFKPKQDTPWTPSPSPQMSLCIEVDDLEGAIALLASLGYPPHSDIQLASHGREVYAYDPQGNSLILYEPKASG